jgi:hypothetical protein
MHRESEPPRWQIFFRDGKKSEKFLEFFFRKIKGGKFSLLTPAFPKNSQFRTPEYAGHEIKPDRKGTNSGGR